MALKISVLCAAAALLVTGIRVIRPEIALAVALAAGAAACVLMLGEIKSIAEVIKRAQGTYADAQELSLMLKACGITLAAEYASQICRDAGEGALSQRVEMAARITLLALCAPLAGEALDAILEMAG